MVGALGHDGRVDALEAERAQRGRVGREQVAYELDDLDLDDVVRGGHLGRAIAARLHVAHVLEVELLELVARPRAYGVVDAIGDERNGVLLLRLRLQQLQVLEVNDHALDVSARGEERLERVKAEAELGQVDARYVRTEALLDEEARVLDADETRRAPLGLGHLLERERVPQRVRVRQPIPLAIDARAPAQVTYVQIGEYLQEQLVRNRIQFGSGDFDDDDADNDDDDDSGCTDVGDKR